MKLLFVCLGNICRSPTAEAIATQLIKQQGLSWFCDSAGTNGFHDGEPADPRSIRHGKVRGYSLTSVSRQITSEDFKNFDLLLAMDQNNVKTLEQICPDPQLLGKIKLITDYATHDYNGVPDPYYGGAQGFERVIDILEDSCAGLIAALRNQN